MREVGPLHGVPQPGRELRGFVGREHAAPREFGVPGHDEALDLRAVEERQGVRGNARELPRRILVGERPASNHEATLLVAIHEGHRRISYPAPQGIGRHLVETIEEDEGAALIQRFEERFLREGQVLLAKTGRDELPELLRRRRPRHGREGASEVA